MYFSRRSILASTDTQGYRVPLPPGRFRIALHFAEAHFNKPGRRRFHIALEGMRVLEDYEPKVREAEVKVFETRVEDGILDISLIDGSIGNPRISAIEIERLEAASGTKER